MEVIVLKKCPMCGSNKTKLIEHNSRIMCPICNEWVWRGEADIYEKEQKNG